MAEKAEQSKLEGDTTKQSPMNATHDLNRTVNLNSGAGGYFDILTALLSTVMTD